MKNAEIRRVLESEILRLRVLQKPIQQSEFNEYYNCLVKLQQLDKISALNQKKVYTCTYGNLGRFVLDFLENVSPLISKRGKKIHFNSVLDSHTPSLFSPRLTEIALGCMLSDFLNKNNHIDISFSCTNLSSIIAVSGKDFQGGKLNLTCINHIAKLHEGRSIIGYFGNYNQIALLFPFFPQFQPLKTIPCSAELCRLCHL